MKLVTKYDIVPILRQLLELAQGTPIAIDCETTGLHPYQGDKLRGFSFAFRNEHGVQSYYVPVGYGDSSDLAVPDIQTICGAIQSVDPIYVYHHSKFDLRFLRQLPAAPSGGKYFSVPKPGYLWDTKIVAFLIDENLSSSLGPQAQLHLGEGKDDRIKAILKERGGWDKLTATDTAVYGAKDAELTLRLREVQLELLSHPMTYGNPTAAVDREHHVMGVLLRMEDTGIKLDRDRLAKLLEEGESRCEQIEIDFMDSFAVNVGSNQQVAELLFETLKDCISRKDGKALPVIEPGTQVIRNGKPVFDKETGAPVMRRAFPSVARSVLEGLVENEIIDAILEHRRLRKAVSSYLRPLTGFVADDGRVHPTFWQHGTVTGRFSCSDPNLQTIPRADTLKGVRSVFTAEEGYELWSFDLNSAEMRVVAGMANERVLIEGLAKGTDMHGVLAEQVFGPDFTGIQRRFAKNIGYGFFYGLTSAVTAAKYISGPNPGRLAHKILTGLRDLYPNVVKLMKRAEQEAKTHGYVKVHDKAWPGRYRRFVTEAEKKPFPYTALNAKVQGGIGEFVKDVMLEAEPVLDKIGARLCLQVHDELVIEVPAGHGPSVLRLLNEISARINPFDLPMPFNGQEWDEHE